MKRPLHLWLIFGLCLLLILPAMIWLTRTAIELNHDLQEDRRQTELARREAELQEKINSALYRMDWKLGPHIAREAARPWYLYQPFYRPTREMPELASPNDQAAQVDGLLSNTVINNRQPGELNMWEGYPSPLLYQNARFVRLHFQIAADNQFSSPKRPVGEAAVQQAFLCCGVTKSAIDSSDALLHEVRSFCSFPQLATQLATDPELDSEQQQAVFLQTQIQNFLTQRGNRITKQQSDPPLPNKPSGVGLGGFTKGKAPAKSKLQGLRSQQRGDTEFVKRQQAYNDNTIEWAGNTWNVGTPTAQQEIQLGTGTGRSTEVVEGVMRPIWIGDELLLARRTQVEEQDLIQCCWLAWDEIQKSLREEVSDILPNVQFEPVRTEQDLVPGRALVTLPAQVVVDTPKLLASLSMGRTDSTNDAFSGIKVALWLAWLGLLLSTLAIGLLLTGVIRLSERRAAFVSAVTHELRTPLTTFRMYSEMLADKMVAPEKQSQYANTLKIQADRLSHLVENVLQFARLEKGPSKNTQALICVDELLDRVRDRLNERAEQANMTIKFQVDPKTANRKLRIEPGTFEQILFNLVDNACKYAAKSEPNQIDVTITGQGDTVSITVRDYGPGIDSAFRRRLFQPFCKSDLEAANSAPGVGLGLALCQRMAESIGGRLREVPCEKGAQFELEIPVA